MPAFFKTIFEPHSDEQILKAFGEFDPADLDPKDQGDPAKVAKAKAAHDEKALGRRYHDPASVKVSAIGFLDESGGFSFQEQNEPALIRHFWERFTASGQNLQGWGIFDRDLYFLKALSWKHGIKVPPEIMRPAGAGRTGWIGFTDVKREMLGGPSSSFHDIDPSLLLRATGSEVGWTSDEEFSRDGTPEHLESELRALAKVSARIGFGGEPSENSDGSRTGSHGRLSDAEIDELIQDIAQGSGPITFDLETAPGDLAAMKVLTGGFDPRNVKVGNLVDPAKIAKKIADAKETYDEELLVRSMKDPLLGRISAAGFKTHGNKPIIPDVSEKDLLRLFWRIREKSPQRLQGWNVLNFDMRWLRLRSMMHEVRVPSSVMRPAGSGYARWNGITDLMREFTGSPSEFYGLDRVCRMMDLPGKNGDGKDFYRLYESKDTGERQRGIDYLSNDVTIEELVGDKMGFGGPGVASPGLGIPGSWLEAQIRDLTKRFEPPSAADVADVAY